MSTLLKPNKLEEMLLEKEQLLEKINYLERILELIPGHIYWKNRAGIYQGCNGQMAKQLKLNTSLEIKGKTVFELIPQYKELAEKTFLEDEHIMATNREKNFEEEGLDTQGNEALFATNKVLLHDLEGNVLGLIGVSLNVTKRKQMEDALRLALVKSEATTNQAKTEFLENMRHDIRTPLSGIIGCAELLGTAKDLDQVKEYASLLVKSSYALLDYHNEILDWIKVTVGEVPLANKKIDLHKQLTDIIDLNQSLATKKKLALNFDYDKTIPTYLIGDPIRAQRIVLELLTNALTFTKEGAINLTVKRRPDKKGHIILEITVSDTGIGIPKDKLEDIFVRFNRLTPSYQGIYKGLGLGLAAVKQFIEDLSGEIYVNSQLGEGSSFTCLLPFKEPLTSDNLGFEEAPIQIGSAANQSTKIKTSKVTLTDGARILLVEDNPLAACAEQHILSNFNCQIDHAKDAKTAIEFLKYKDYQLILMDIGLPDIDGITLTQQIRLKHWQKTHATLPIVGLTAHFAHETEQRCLNAGMNLVIHKPLKKETAQELLMTFVKKEVSHEATIQGMPNLKGPILNFDEIKRLIRDDNLIEECRCLTISGLTEDLAILSDYYKKKDWKRIEGLAHKWQGSSIYYSAERLNAICKYFSEYQRSGRLEQLDVIYQQMIQEMELVKQACIQQGLQE